MNNNTLVKEILELRLKGMGIRTIAKELNCSLDKVKYYCKKNNLDGVRSNNALIGEPFERFLRGFKKRHGDRFEYVSGFINSEKLVTIKCKTCGDTFERSAQIARKDKKLTCVTCQKVNAESRVEIKNIEKLRNKILRESVRLPRALIEIDVKKCIECGKLFSDKRNSCCSKGCKNRRANRQKEIRRRKQLRENGKVDYALTLQKVIERENNVCYICGDKCDSSDYKHDDKGSFIVGPNYPSIEHIVPVSKGGTHTWDNVKLAHHYCNTIKNDKDIVEDNGQMVLII